MLNRTAALRRRPLRTLDLRTLLWSDRSASALRLLP
jgi:hypothetical protein